MKAGQHVVVQKPAYEDSILAETVKNNVTPLFHPAIPWADIITFAATLGRAASIWQHIFKLRMYRLAWASPHGRLYSQRSSQDHALQDETDRTAPNLFPSGTAANSFFNAPKYVSCGDAAGFS